MLVQGIRISPLLLTLAICIQIRLICKKTMIGLLSSDATLLAAFNSLQLDVNFTVHMLVAATARLNYIQNLHSLWHCTLMLGLGTWRLP